MTSQALVNEGVIGGHEFKDTVVFSYLAFEKEKRRIKRRELITAYDEISEEKGHGIIRDWRLLLSSSSIHCRPEMIFKLILKFMNPLEWVRAYRFHRKTKAFDKSEFDLELYFYSKVLKNDMLHYGYFDAWSTTYDQFMMIVPYLAMGPGLFTGALTLGVMVQVSNAFSRVHGGFSLFLHNWTTITELRSIWKRLHEFEHNLDRYAVAVPA